MLKFPLAVVSDIHGNCLALEAVLEEIERRNISDIINLGDTFYGPLAPLATAELLKQYPDIIHIKGNGERILLSPSANRTIIYTQSELGPDMLEIISCLPEFYADKIIYACHGAPDSDTSYLLEDVKSKSLHNVKTVEKLLGHTAQALVFCGHSHISRTFYLNESGQLVINPGSVGLPAYSDTEPIVHRMESGSPMAQFAVIHQKDTFWNVEHINIPYDWNAASNMAEKNGRADWAYALKTGRAL